MTVLVVEDDEIILEGLKFALMQEGYRVLTAASVKQAEEIMQAELRIDFYLLDLMLPDGDGCTLCREIRLHSDAPVLFLTACDDEVSTVRALEQGADDYIAKPFRIRELLARMKAIQRRTANAQSAGGSRGRDPQDIQNGGKKESDLYAECAVIGEMRISLQNGRMYHAEEEVPLTAMEYRLLLIFLNHRGQTLTRRQIIGCIWDEAGDYVNDNTLSVYIKRLRAKLGDVPEGRLIQTVRGIGYRLV
ncbi:MAG: response regulator transcription factor [Lachnospiraceae bacterium]|nr:response regulator transcription factor [Lachnospiraceae bacterium]